MKDLFELVEKLKPGGQHSAHNDDVFIDRLNHKYTVSMIMIFAAIVTTAQYFGSPISCWVPAQFTTGYEKYANDICWIMNTYYIPLDHDIPHAEPTRYERTLKYYQWSPFILLFMGFCFYFPRMVWRSLNNKSGLDVEKLIEEVMKQEFDDKANPPSKKSVTYIVDTMRLYLDNHYNQERQPRRSNIRKQFVNYLTFWRHRHMSIYIVALFTIVKLLFLINSIAQIFLLNAFLGNEYHLFGFEVIAKFVRGLDWGESKRFPRVTLCDFHIREVGIVHRYTVQCVLPINLFNEKIFLILWFWILILAAFNVGDFVAWVLRVANLDSRKAYVKRKLSMVVREKASGSGRYKARDEEAEDNRRMGLFVRDYLQTDGCFVLRLLARNGQDMIVSDVIHRLYRHYNEDLHGPHHDSDTSRLNHNISPRNQYQVPTNIRTHDRSVDEEQSDNNENKELVESRP